MRVELKMKKERIKEGQSVEKLVSNVSNHGSWHLYLCYLLFLFIFNSITFLLDIVRGIPLRLILYSSFIDAVCSAIIDRALRVQRFGE